MWARRWRARVGLTNAGIRVVLVALCAVLLAGCASFPDTGPRDWHDKPKDNGPLMAPPVVPNTPPDAPDQDRQGPGQQGQQSGPNGCTDPDPQVVATCLSPVSAIAVLPDSQSALVAERATGRILLVQKGKDPQPYATVPVNASGGGLIGLVLSPSYQEDSLIYVYAASGSDHRVLRIAKGFPPVPVLTGIPATPGDDSGGLAVGKGGALLVATGSSAPDPGAGSLAGKLLRIDTFGHPMPDNPDPRSPIFSSGLRSPGGVCVGSDGGAWVTDRIPERDVLYQMNPGPVGIPAWGWPERPHVAGCAAPSGSLLIAERGGSALFLLRTSPQGGFTGTPQTLLAGTYGRLSPVVLAADGLIWLGTNNKGGGGPVVSSDDRVIRIQPPSGGAAGGPD
ncbi:MAG TPA: PQQ-dependent sugar dehydrogenase [Pseudonocardia sp.]|jgi:glucose/arabinose dehydrogenase|nr:PQQ-dependent sugar dehydrogenase [Pseudonocardia sp.]